MNEGIDNHYRELLYAVLGVAIEDYVAGELKGEPDKESRDFIPLRMIDGIDAYIALFKPLVKRERKDPKPRKVKTVCPACGAKMIISRTKTALNISCEKCLCKYGERFWKYVHPKYRK